MALKIWTGTVDSEYDTAGNWAGAAVPIDNDDLLFDGRAVNNCDGFTNPLAVGFGTVTFAKGFKFSLGSSAENMDPTGNGGASIDKLIFEGSGAHCYIECAAGAAVCPEVHIDSPSVSEDALHLEGFYTNIHHGRGKVTLDAATVTGEIRMEQAAGNSTKLSIPSGSTLTSSTVHLNGGQVVAASTPVTVRQAGGEFILAGSAAMTALEQTGGLFWWDSSGTITAAVCRGGQFSSARADLVKTLTNMSIWAPAVVDFSRSHQITFTNAVKLYGGAGPLLPSGAELTIAL